MLALIDADILAHKAAFAAERRVHEVQGRAKEFKYKKDAVAWCKEHAIALDLITLVRYADYNRERLYHSVENMISDTIERTGADEYLLCFSGKNVFRHNINRTATGSSTYKQNRSKDSKPILLEDTVNMLRAHPFLVHDELEADDLLGLLQTSNTIICSIDKDLHQIPGRHFNLNSKEFRYVSRKEARRFLWKQVLTGDAVDGIRGIPGVGSKKADAILDSGDGKNYMARVVFAYADAGLRTKEYAESLYKVLILRRGLHDHPYVDMAKIKRDIGLGR